MTPPTRCFAFGHRISTDIALPGALCDDSPLAPEIVIRRGSPFVGGGDADRILWRDGGTLHYRPQGVASYRCSAPGTIDVAPCPGADEDEVAALLLATALPGLLWLRGGFMLHAAAAVMPGHGRAVAIAAASGGGKSTVLAELVGRGARVAADDCVRLHPTEAGIAASGLAGGYFAYHPDPAGRPFVAIDPRQAVREAPLGAILVLARHAAGQPATLQRLPPLEALAAILSHRHRPAIPVMLADRGRFLADAARVARAPTYRWSRPDKSVPLTAAEWRTIVRLIEEPDDGQPAVAARK